MNAVMVGGEAVVIVGVEINATNLTLSAEHGRVDVRRLADHLDLLLLL
jgi:hypothetical protein